MQDVNGSLMDLFISGNLIAICLLCGIAFIQVLV